MQSLAWMILALGGGAAMTAAESSRGPPTPIVLWHGMGDSCCNPFSMGSVKKLLESQIPGVYVLSLMIGGNAIEDTENGFVMNINKQIELACDTIRNDSRLSGGFHGVGFSQGGLFLRGLVQRCGGGDLRVKNLVSFGGPQQGVYGVPECLGEKHYICDYMRRLLNYGAYTSWIQSVLVQAQYWHDPLAEAEYVEKSLFLADINNQGAEKRSEYAANLVTLDNLVLVKFSRDTMVDPKESEWFGWYDERDGKTIVPLNATRLYREDWIGLRQLDQAGKLQLLSVDGNHLQIDDATFDMIISNYLK